MSGKVMPTAPGSRFQRDSHPPPFHSPKKPHPDGAEEDPQASDSVSIGISQARYQSSIRRDNSDLQNAVTYSQTQEGFLRLVERALDQMADLSVRCQDDRESSSNRAQFAETFTRLQCFVSDIGTKTFNGLSLFSGVTLRISGENSDPKAESDAITISSEGFGEDVAIAYDPGATSVKGPFEASMALLNIRRARKGLSKMQQRVNANLQRLSLSSEQLTELSRNLADAKKRINSIDRAGKFTQLARYRILGQAQTAKMAQANAVPEAAMRLLD